MAEENKTPQKKPKPKGHVVYVGPTIPEVPIKFAQIFETPPAIPENLKEVITPDFFVPLKEFPKAKRKLKEKREQALRTYRLKRRKQ